MHQLDQYSLIERYICMNNKTITIGRHEQVLKRFKSCFLCEVEFYPNYVIVIDSNKVEYYIMTDNVDAISSFKFWFTNVFMKGIPQVLSIIEYDIKSTEDDGTFYYVNRLIANPGTKSEPNLLNEDSNSKQLNG